jgi:hypothetical protein
MKYKNKDGVSLSYTNNDVHTKLVKEVIIEAIKILKDSYSYGRGSTTAEAIDFLKENFNLEDNNES